MISSIISRLVILVFGTLYPAYASYKAVRTKNVKEYVKWMMYWIVFALFTCAETFTDVFCSFWFPFYYEFKVILVLWLLSPATKGSSILYRKFVHPMLTKREQEIDEYIAKAKEQGYHTVLTLGSKGVNYATTVIMQTAIKNLNLPNSVSSFSLVPENPAPQPIAQTSTVTVEEVQCTSVTRLQKTVDETDFTLSNNMVESHRSVDAFSSDDDSMEFFSPTKRAPSSRRPNTRSRNAKKTKSYEEFSLKHDNGDSSS